MKWKKDVVPYIGTWIETVTIFMFRQNSNVVPYIGTWIETIPDAGPLLLVLSYLI